MARFSAFAALALALACLLALFAVPTYGEEAAGDAKAAEEVDTSGTKDLLDQLTIDMSAEVIDERTFALRDRAKATRKLIRLGNVAPIEKGSMSDEEYENKVQAAKDH